MVQGAPGSRHVAAGGAHFPASSKIPLGQSQIASKQVKPLQQVLVSSQVAPAARHGAGGAQLPLSSNIPLGQSQMPSKHA